MTKQEALVPVPAGNAAKYFSYREAWGRIRKSIAHGYHLEAVTLEESIMSDRLSSYLVRVGAVGPDAKLERESFAKLIKNWRSCVPEPISDAHYSDLQMAVDAWRSRRKQDRPRNRQVTSRRCTSGRA